MAQVDADRKRREREALVLLYLLLIDDTHAHLSQQVTQYLSGSVSVHSLSRSFTATLFGAHVQATYYGRRASGVTQPMGEADEQFATVVMRGQASYITKLLNALTSARYPFKDDGSIPDALRLRLWWFAQRLRGTANEAWGFGHPPGTRFLWNLGVNVEKHCEVCPERERESHVEPYTAATMPGWPGDWSTPCGGACDCNVTTVDGEECFPFVRYPYAT